MASNSAFGLPQGETPEGDDPFADAPEIPDTAEPEPEVTPEPAVAPPAEVPAPEVEPELEPALAEETPPEPVGTPYEGRYSTKYQTIEQMEEAHRNALSLAQRQAEHSKEVEQQLQQATAYLQAALRHIEEQEKAKSAPPKVDIAARAAEAGYDEETLKLARQLAEEAANERVAPLQSQLEQQEQMRLAAEQQAYVNAQTTAAQTQIASFRARAELQGEDEDNMVVIFNEFGLDPTVPDNYDIALEAARHPDLAEVFRANPSYIDTDAGLNLARKLAGVHTVTAPGRPVADLAAARKKATVEGGSSGAAPVGEDSTEADDWQKVLDVAAGSKNVSAFGLPK